MKEKMKGKSKTGAQNSVNTPPPPQVIDPSKPPVTKKKEKTGKTKVNDQEKLAPKEEL